MAETPRQTRKLVKALLLPDLHTQLVAYASAHHRSLSSAAEHLIAIGLRVENTPEPTAFDPTADVHTR